ncbi:MAG: hypothetical protein HXY22_07675 [Alphaproteobacteria bacterium]|nr:hypothetical protein [Alphaproteobacteria bacterium]
MSLFSALFAVVLGLLAAPQLVLARRPDAQGALDSITPYSGWLGILAGLTGVWTVLSALLHFGHIWWNPVYWFSWFGLGFVLLALGFLLGYGVLSQLFLTKSPETAAQAEQIRVKLAPFQSVLALISVALGLWGIVLHLIFVF